MAMQYRLSTLMVVVAWVGLTCLALRQPSVYWSWPIAALSFMAMGAMVPAIVYAGGRGRAFAVGFLAFGVAYYISMWNATPGNEMDIVLPLYERVHGPRVQPGGFFGPGAPRTTQYMAFAEIFHRSLTVLFGCIGGAIGETLYAWQPRDRR